jgi:phosphoglycolate phosphatase-like HAD superfamily hydrolase
MDAAGPLEERCPRHVVWDWNGTLLDDASTVIAATTAAFREAGVPLELTAELYRRHFTRPIPLFYERLLDRPLAPEEWVAMDHAFHRHYGRLRGACELAAGGLEALEELRRRGWTQSVCSMQPHRLLVPAVEAFGIAGYFVRVDGLSGGERGGAKLGHLVRHLELLGVPPRQTVLVGDTVDDAVAARGAGCWCILLDGGAGLHEPSALAAAGVPVAPDLRAVLTLLDALRGSGGDEAAGKTHREAAGEERATLER